VYIAVKQLNVVYISDKFFYFFVWAVGPQCCKNQFVLCLQLTVEVLSLVAFLTFLGVRDMCQVELWTRYASPVAVMPNNA